MSGGEIRIAVASLLFNWPSTGGGTIHTKELCEFLSQAGYRVRHLVARHPDFGVGRMDERLPYDCVPLEFNTLDWTADGIRARFRHELGRFRPDHVIVTDSWNTKPLLCEAAAEYPYWIRIAAQETICPLNNVRLLIDEFGQAVQCRRNQFASPGHCRMCVQENGRFNGRMHVAERNLAGFQDLIYPQRLRDAFAAAAGVLVVNPLVAEAIRPHARAVHVVPSGFDRNRFPDVVTPRQRRAGEKLRVLFAGLVNEHMKGFSVLYEACRQLWRQRRDFELVATANPVGQADEFTRLVGWQSQAALPRVIVDADAVAFPTIAQEALGRSAVEAMACGRPVVASRLGGLPWVVDDGVTGLLFDPGDARDLSRLLARLFDHRALRHRMGDAGRAKFEREFTWDRIIQRHYQPLLGGTAAPVTSKVVPYDARHR